jgi:lysophospholipase L1-like esterase
MAKTQKFKDLPPINDLNQAFMIGLDASGNDAKFPLSAIRQAKIADAILSGVPTSSPQIGQYYDLIGAGYGQKPSGTYPFFHIEGGGPLVIPEPAAGNAILEPFAWYNGSFWVASWQEKTLPIQDVSGLASKDEVNNRLGATPANLLTSASYNGFYTAQGALTANANFRAVSVPVTAGYIYNVKLVNNTGTLSAACIVGVKADNSVVLISDVSFTGLVTIPAGVVTLLFTSRATGGDTYYVYKILPVDTRVSVVESASGANTTDVAALKTKTDTTNANLTAASALAAATDARLGGQPANLLTAASTTGYYTAQGVLTAGANWRNVVLNVIAGYTISVKLLNAEPGPYSACCVLGYKADNSVVAINPGSFTGNLTLDPLIVKVALTSKAAAGDVYSVTQVSPVADRTAVLETKVGTKRIGVNLLPSSSTAGYYTAAGNFVASANWRSVKLAKTVSVLYVSLINVPSPSGMCVIYWKADNSVVVLNDIGVVGAVTLPTEAVAYALTTRAITGDSYYAYTTPDVPVTDALNTLLNTGASASAARVISTYLPKKVYGVIGEPVRVYPYNLVALNDRDLSIDMFFAHQQSNEKALIIESPAANETLTLRLRNYDGLVQNFGDIPLVVKTPANPASSFFILPIGDSLGAGVNATREGAWPNELSRLFNGIGDALPNGNIAKTFTNVKVIGTMGARPIKYEGRPGWDLNQYLNQQSALGINNAFYNPAKSKFDLDYYLTQNGFYTAGVTSNGSNLTLVIMLNWNSVYQHTDSQFIGWYTELINLIHTSHSGAKIIILGINPPPGLNYKTYTGDRNVSRASILADCIRYENNLDTVAAAFPTFVEHVPLLPTFCAEGAYPTIALKTNLRTVATDTYYSDHVHPVDNGYGQIADIVYRAIANRL